MTREEKYDKVNQTTTLDQLAEVIESFGDENQMIQGRTRVFSAIKMAQYCRNFTIAMPELLTREFGIRQQAMLISYYNNQMDKY